MSEFRLALHPCMYDICSMFVSTAGIFLFVVYGWLMRMLEQQINSCVFLGLIRKWLKTGILEKEFFRGLSFRLRKYCNYFGILVCFSIPLNATTFYVSLLGNDNWSGISPDSAWCHIAYAATQAQAGDTVHIKAGNYGSEHVVISHSGTAGNPIVFEGYKDIPGDIPEPEWLDLHTPGGLPAPEVDPAEMPLLDGEWSSGTGIEIQSKSYIKLKNIQITRYHYCLNAEDVTNSEFNNIIAVASDWYTICIEASSYCDVLNCTAVDGDMCNLGLFSVQNCLVENCQTHGTVNAADGPDYYICMSSTGGGSFGNTINHCYARNHRTNVYHSTHGIGFKSIAYNNEVVDCVARAHGKCFYVRHHNIYNNTFINCTAYDDGLSNETGTTALVVRDGAHNNEFINCRGIETTNGISFYDTSEDGDNTHSGHSNTFINCIFKNLGSTGINFDEYTYDSPAQDNEFRNCVFIDSGTLIYHETHDNTGNVMNNSIVTDYNTLETGPGSGDVAITYSDFWNNSFTTPSGTGNMEEDPLFADTVTGDYHLKSEYGRWCDSTWIYDDVTSPCIDTGDPSDDYSNEPEPNGDRINVGAFGNTAEASRSNTTGIEDEPGLSPSVPVLTPPVPNPFMTRCVFNFITPSEGDVRIAVYDLSGRMVRTLIDGSVSAGIGSVSWSGISDDGNILPSGCYTVVMTGYSGTASIRLVLVR